MPMFEGIDFATVPDKMTPLGIGFVEFTIENVKMEKSKGDAAAGKLPEDMYLFESVVSQPSSPDDGRPHTVYAMPTKKMGQITIKRMALSCGLTPGPGLTTESFIGKKWKGHVTHSVNVYRGKQQTQAEVEILIPGDQGY